jgi:hypothetical protein
MTWVGIIAVKNELFVFFSDKYNLIWSLFAILFMLLDLSPRDFYNNVSSVEFWGLSNIFFSFSQFFYLFNNFCMKIAFSSHSWHDMYKTLLIHLLFLIVLSLWYLFEVDGGKKKPKCTGLFDQKVKQDYLFFKISVYSS